MNDQGSWLGNSFKQDCNWLWLVAPTCMIVGHATWWLLPVSVNGILFIVKGVVCWWFCVEQLFQMSEIFASCTWGRDKPSLGASTRRHSLFHETKTGAQQRFLPLTWSDWGLDLDWRLPFCFHGVHFTLNGETCNHHQCCSLKVMWLCVLLCSSMSTAWVVKESNGNKTAFHSPAWFPPSVAAVAAPLVWSLQEGAQLFANSGWLLVSSLNPKGVLLLKGGTRDNYPHS